MPGRACLGMTSVPLDEALSSIVLEIRVSFGRVFMINTRAQWNLLHTWIILVIIKQYLVQIGRVDGPVEHSSYILAAIRSRCRGERDPRHLDRQIL